MMPNLTSMLGTNGLASESQGVLAETAVQPTDLTAYRELTNTALPRYDLAVAATTSTLDLAAQQVFRVDASVNRTLSFANESAVGRGQPVVIFISGNGTITWPAGIDWSGNTAPEQNVVWTVVTLLDQGAGWYGFKSGGAD